MLVNKIIDASNITVFQNGSKIIDELSFYVDRGEIFTFIGDKNSGKYLLMKVIAGVKKPASGEIKVFGRDINVIWYLRKRIGVIDGLAHDMYEELTVYDNLKFYSELYEVKEIDKRIREVLNLLKITNYINKKVSQLDRNTKRLISLAKVLIHEPEIILLYEPLSEIDRTTSIHILKILKRLQETGKYAMVLFTSDFKLAHKISSRIAVLKDGKILTIASPDSVRSLAVNGYKFEILIKNLDATLLEELKNNSYIKQLDIVDEKKIHIILEDKNDLINVTGSIAEHKGNIIYTKFLYPTLDEIYRGLLKKISRIGGGQADCLYS